jgi:hypothetical protein
MSAENVSSMVVKKPELAMRELVSAADARDVGKLNKVWKIAD